MNEKGIETETPRPVSDWYDESTYNGDVQESEISWVTVMIGIIIIVLAILAPFLLRG